MENVIMETVILRTLPKMTCVLGMMLVDNNN